MALPNTSVITIERFIIEQERQFPEATGELSNLLYDIALGAKIIAAAVRRAGILEILGSAGGGNGTLEDVLQPGRNQVAAGYVMYGSSVMLAYSTGQGVHGFTLDPTIGEFVLSHPNIRIPAGGRYYSVNESYFARWPRAVQRAGRGFHGDFPERIQAKNSRYIGALVADFRSEE